MNPSFRELGPLRGTSANPVPRPSPPSLSGCLCQPQSVRHTRQLRHTVVASRRFWRIVSEAALLDPKASLRPQPNPHLGRGTVPFRLKGLKGHPRSPFNIFFVSHPPVRRNIAALADGVTALRAELLAAE